MKKLSKKLAAGFLAFAMVLTTALPYLPSIDAFAASKTMAHIVSGAENGNTLLAVQSQKHLYYLQKQHLQMRVSAAP